MLSKESMAVLTDPIFQKRLFYKFDRLLKDKKARLLTVGDLFGHSYLVVDRYEWKWRKKYPEVFEDSNDGRKRLAGLIYKTVTGSMIPYVFITENNKGSYDPSTTTGMMEMDRVYQDWKRKWLLNKYLTDPSERSRLKDVWRVVMSRRKSRVDNPVD